MEGNLQKQINTLSLFVPNSEDIKHYNITQRIPSFPIAMKLVP